MPDDGSLGKTGQGADSHRDASENGLLTNQESPDKPRSGRGFPGNDAPSLSVVPTLAKSARTIPWYFCVRRKGTRD